MLLKQTDGIEDLSAREFFQLRATMARLLELFGNNVPGPSEVSPEEKKALAAALLILSLDFDKAELVSVSDPECVSPLRANLVCLPGTKLAVCFLTNLLGEAK